jgi:hypothetical protein
MPTHLITNLNSCQTNSKAKAAGLEIRFLPPAALQDLVRAETAGWANTIESANITVQ